MDTNHPNTVVKISLLLMRYFYQTRRLRLPGLGIFTLDKNTVIPQHADNQAQTPTGAQFQRVTVTAADAELIAFISENTGKIKPLAIADLESFLGLGIQMLNIGKPFLLEGIGTVIRQPTGKYEFEPGFFGLMPVESPDKDPKRISNTKRSPDAAISSGEPDELRSLALGTSKHHILRYVALLAAVLIVGGGGYMLYRHQSPSNVFSDSTVNVAGLMTPDDKAGSAPVADQTPKEQPAPAPVVAAPDTAEVRFVILSTANKAHALRRYNQLKGFDLKPKLFEKDSTWFKIYFSFPVNLKDTVHIKDSLRRQYNANVSIDR